MAMNNWGGVTEHMTKKSRKFFGRKRKISTDGNKNKLSNSTIVKANQKKRNKMIKELLILIFVLFIIFVGLSLFSK